MPNDEPVQLVVFDLGGVLVRCVDGWRHACERADVPFHDALTRPEVQAPIAEASHQMERGEIEPRDFIHVVSQRCDYRPDDVEAVLHAWLIELFDGVELLLTGLRDAGVRTATLSNTNALHWATMLHSPGTFAPLQIIDQPCASHLIGSRKPEPQAYAHIEQATGVAPKAILYFDDVEENVAAAVAHRWRASRINPREETVVQIEFELARYGVL